MMFGKTDFSYFLKSRDRAPLLSSDTMIQATFFVSPVRWRPFIYLILKLGGSLENSNMLLFVVGGGGMNTGKLLSLSELCG